MISKKILRENISKKRKTIEEQKRKIFSLSLCQNISQSQVFVSAQNILLFAGTKEEPDLFPLFKEFYHKKCFFFPRIQDYKDSLFEAKRLFSQDFLEKNKWGILEPPSSSPSISSKYIDLFLVPAVAIDENGNRIGMGKGFYDRFLEKTSGQKWGVIFEMQRVKSIPVENHDIPLDGFFTEEKEFLIQKTGAY